MIKKYFLIGAIALLTGCISQVVSIQEHINTWVGRLINDYIEVYKKGDVDRSGYKGTQQVFTNENGELIYEFPHPLYRLFFEVNSSLIIINGYTVES